jgi:hypothetical protein
MGGGMMSTEIMYASDDIRPGHRIGPDNHQRYANVMPEYNSKQAAIRFLDRMVSMCEKSGEFAGTVRRVEDQVVLQNIPFSGGQEPLFEVQEKGDNLFTIVSHTDCPEYLLVA